MKLFQNKFFLIALCVAVSLAAATSTLSLMGYHTMVRNVLGTVTFPFRWCATTVTNAFEGFGRYFTSLDTLYGENEALKQENEALKNRLEDAALIEAENARLREYLDVKSQNPTFALCEAMIVSRESGNYMTVFTLNRGSLHGIKVNMPVITKDGIVGCVSEVGLNWSKVTTIIESASSVGAYVPRSGESGIVSGDFSLKNEGKCKFSYVSQTADIVVGDRVLSSGMGSVYPADLPIGRVVEIGEDEYNRTFVATVEPAVELSSLQWVMIVTGFGEEP